MSSSNQRPANRGFRSVLRCTISHYRQIPSLSAPRTSCSDRCSLARVLYPHRTSGESSFRSPSSRPRPALPTRHMSTSFGGSESCPISHRIS